jgi:hypothetical protein
MINVEMANDLEVVQDGRIFIEKVNALFLAAGGNGSEFRAEIECWPVPDSTLLYRNNPRRSRNGLNSDIARGPKWAILLQKSFWGVERKFLEPLMRFALGDVRDHVG